MKRFIESILLSAALTVCVTACEDYLDKSPDLGLDESVIYASFESIRGYIDECYPLLYRWNTCQNFNGMNQDLNSLGISDEIGTTVNQNSWANNNFNQGNWYASTRNSNWEVGVQGSTVIANSYAALRIANRVIASIDKVANCSDEEKNWILGQAYFYRGWFYYELVKRYGGMPMLDRVFNGGDDDIARMTAQQSFDWLVSNLDKAIALLPDLWDDNNYSRPDKAAAYGVKAEAMLYQASPLYQNDLEKTEKKPYNKEVALKAAKACQECLKYIETTSTGRKFSDGADYKAIFTNPNTTFNNEEYLWWDRRQMTNQEQANTIRRMWQWIDIDFNTGVDAQSFGCPSANIVALYEKKGPDGNYYPIYDSRSGYQFKAEAEGVADTEKWKYDAGVWANTRDRDPRYYINLLLPGEEYGMREGHEYYIESWENSRVTNAVKSGNLSSVRQFSGWLCKKYTWPECSMKYVTSKDTDYLNRYYMKRIRSFYIRVTGMYLDYAEALFEATGSATTKPEGYDMTPVEAINKVRARIGVTPVQSPYDDAEHFRETYRRERAVELMFENHRFEDIRRWMLYDELFPTSAGWFYNYVWTCDQNDVQNATNQNNVWQVIRDNYNHGQDLTFSYRLEVNNIEVRAFNTPDNKYYLYPFPGAEVGSLGNLSQNPGW